MRSANDPLSEVPNFLTKQLFIFELTYFPFGDKSIAEVVYVPGPGTLFVIM